MIFFRMIRHLLPSGRAWRITVDKMLRKFFEGLAGLGESVRTFVDLVWLDILPEATRDLDAWEYQFGLQSDGLMGSDRRVRLDAAWKALGGQSPKYIQDTLRNNGFDVYLHEWFDPASLGTIFYCGDIPAQCGQSGVECAALDAGVIRNPNDYIAYPPEPGKGYPLVNKADGVVYTIHPDPNTWPYYLYIGGETFGSFAGVPGDRLAEFEALCLKVCPLQMWLGIFITVEYRTWDIGSWRFVGRADLMTVEHFDGVAWRGTGNSIFSAPTDAAADAGDHVQLVGPWRFRETDGYLYIDALAAGVWLWTGGSYSPVDAGATITGTIARIGTGSYGYYDAGQYLILCYLLGDVWVNTGNNFFA